MSQHSPAFDITARLRSPEQAGTPKLWEAGFYSLLAAAMALATTLLLFPMTTAVLICTLGAAVSAAIAWLLFACQKERSNLVRMLIVSCSTVMLFIISPLPVWNIVRLVSIWVDPSLVHFLYRESWTAGITMIAVIVVAPLAFVVRFAGTATYWALRSLLVWTWRGYSSAT